jgi:hypothetical protein
MGKLQPNYSWQKYEGKSEDQKEQFQYQLQGQHIVVANSINQTIDDLSYWLRERPVAFTWINLNNTRENGRQIYTQTFQALVSAFPIAHNIKSNSGAALQLNLVRAYGVCQDTIPMTAAGFPIPNINPNNLAAGMGLVVTPTQIALVTAGGAFSTYTATVTIEYTKN